MVGSAPHDLRPHGNRSPGLENRFMPSMARLDPCFTLVHMLVFQEVMLLFSLRALHAQYVAVGAAYAVTLLLSRVLGWSLPAGIHS
eukprot:2730900-Karenia_brevis.AAC.1